MLETCGETYGNIACPVKTFFDFLRNVFQNFHRALQNSHVKYSFIKCEIHVNTCDVHVSHVKFL